MRNRRLQRVLSRGIALALVSVMMIGDASAIIKHVPVWGVRSINDRGASDVRTDLEELEKDYSGYLQSDGLTEYFHKDQGELPKQGMSEALAWLVDNQIISRDSVVTVSRVNNVPVVSITKDDVAAKLYNDVNRSDALMYIYKSVFGPLKGRVMGVETQNIRTDRGSEDTLYKIMNRHDYFSLEEKLADEYIEQKGNAGNGTGGYEVWVPHYDEGGSATGGKGTYQKIYSINDKTSWRYTPQGDKVVSVFGDTNIFVSDVDITQSGDTHGQSGDHGSGGVATGNVNQAIDYDTDYKEIFYVPAADLWLYKTTDVVEMYLQSLQSKGLVEFESSLRTDTYNSTFNELTEKNTLLASWSGQADPYVVNLSTGQHMRVEDVQYSQLSKVLGKSYNIDYTSNTLTIRRVNLFESNTGYFTTEQCNRMDVYRYIYNMVSANEKKISSLEADIVNYKYGLEYGDGLPSGDLEVIKFLVAKGILNYDGSDELSGLYAPITWADLLPILYRVANPNARLDFSKIQLTDSEQAWKAQGFQPSKLRVLPSGSMSQITAEYSDVYYASMSDGEFDVPEIPEDLENTGTGTGTASRMSTRRSTRELEPRGWWETVLAWFGLSKSTQPVELEPGAPDLDWEERRVKKDASATGLPFITYARADDDAPLTLATDCKPGTMRLDGTLYFDFAGASHVKEGDHGLATFKSLLEQMDQDKDCLYQYLRDDYVADNPKHQLLVEYLENFHFIVSVGNGGQSYAQPFIQALEEWANNPSETIKKDTSVNEARGISTPWQEARKNFSQLAIKKLNSAVRKSRVPTGVRYSSVINGSSGALETFFDSPSVDGLTMDQLVESITGVHMPLEITFDYADTDGKVTSQKITFVSQLGKEVDATRQASFLNSCQAKLSSPRMYEDLAAKGEAELTAEFASRMDVFGRTTGIYFEGDGEDGFDAAHYFSDSTLNLYADATSQDQGYVSWSEISAASNGNIVQISELILENRVTHTRAYFSFDIDGSKTRAIVGSVVINGNSKFGVVRKVEEDGIEKMYYHLSAIRQLMSLSDEKECIGGRSCIAMSSEGVIKNTQYFPVLNSAGTQSSQIGAIRAAVHTNAGLGDVANNTNAMYRAGLTVGNTHYCNFISLAQANRVANVIYRKFTYTPENTASEQSGRGVAYGVVIFRPADISEIGSPAVSASTSLQDLMDAPGKPATGDQSRWNENMKQCNDYANWIYGTSGKSYVNTGYLEPEVYLFFLGREQSHQPPANLYGSLTSAERKAITAREMGIVMSGSTAPRNAKVTTEGFDPASAQEFGAYYVDTGYYAMLSGDRLFLNEKLFDNITFRTSNGKSYYELANSNTVVAQFSPGNVFTFFSSSSADYGNPTGRVTAVSSDGTVTVQVGPFKGLPVNYNGRSTMVKGSLSSSSQKVADATWETATRGGTKTEGVDLWLQFYHDIAQRGLAKDWVSGNEGKLCDPALFSSRESVSERVVYNGRQVKVYENLNKVNLTANVSAANASETFSGLYGKLKTSVQRAAGYNGNTGLISKLASIEGYYEIKIPAWNYKITNGVLQYTSNTGMSSFLSPDLFTSLNDMIIDSMIDESSGAIPVNEIPEGSLLQIGTTYYQAIGRSPESKAFVGYAPLTEAVEKPQPVHAVKSFAGQMIYAGNQYINVSHWFKEPFEMLKNGDETTALGNVARKTLSFDGKQKYSIDFNGRSTILATDGAATAEGGAVYTPVKITFLDGLLAYQGTTVEEMVSGDALTSPEDTTVNPGTTEPDSGVTGTGGTMTYVLCNHASTGQDGAFSDVPFLTDDVLNVSLYAVTTDVMSAGFQLNENAPSWRESIQAAFRQVFAHDLLTLVRMLLFVVIIWLVIASWMCYFVRLGNLVPILEAVRYPSGDRSKPGVDLMKLVSFGTINLDTEFSLGRFIQYNAILVALLFVIMLTGRI